MKNADMPAIPVVVVDHEGEVKLSNECYVPGHECTGITKREHFAGLAMQGFASHPDIYRGDVDHVASASVEWADALLAELEKTQ